MHPVPRRFRLAKTLRKLLPGNPVQIVFLLAAICLSACVGRSWLVVPSAATFDAIGPFSRDDLVRWVRVTVVFAFPLLFAGVGAYFCCFFRRENPLKSWLGFVIGPALLGIAGGLLAPVLIVLNARPTSIFDTSARNPFHGLRLPLRVLILNSGTGFQLAVLGLLLAFLGGGLLRTRKALLPIQFDAPSFGAHSEESKSGISRHRVFAIYSLALFSFGGGLLSWPLSFFLVWIFNSIPSNQQDHSFGSWIGATQSLMYILPLFLLAVWTLGKNWRLQLLQSARVPPARIFGLAVALPIVAHWLPHLVIYAIDRVAWAQRWNAMPDAPVAKLYLHVPAMGLHLLPYAFVAALSEWIWRGCMQPQFIRTFGVFRGIFLLGILYGSVQWLLFPAMFGGLAGFFVYLVLQLTWGIVWSIIYGWLTLSAVSVWAAVVCAAFSSVLATGRHG